MANQLYDPGREAFLTGAINWATDNIKVAIVDTGVYTFSAAHQFHSELSGITATSANLTAKTTTGGVADAADVTFTGVTGVQSEALVIYKDTGVSATSPLIAFIDTATGLPVTPNSGDIIVQWSDGANKIFKL